MNLIDLRAEALIAARRAADLGLTQEAIADAVGASQSQVSRILSGHSRKRSRLFDDICKYVNRHSIGVNQEAIISNKDLMEAIEQTWDGTSSHAVALATVIRSLNALGKRTRTRGSGRRAP